MATNLKHMVRLDDEVYHKLVELHRSLDAKTINDTLLFVFGVFDLSIKHTVVGYCGPRKKVRK